MDERAFSAGSLRLRDAPREHLPKDVAVMSLADTLSQLSTCAADIARIEAELQALLSKKDSLQVAERLLAQQHVLDLLLRQGPHSLGVDAGRPVAAIVLYRCLLRWGALGGADEPPCPFLEQLSEALQRVTDEDRITAAHAHAPSPHAATQEMAYWLCCTVTLLALVSPHIPARAPAAVVPADRASTLAGSMAERAAAAAHKVSALKLELQGRMTATFGAFGKNLLMRRTSTSTTGSSSSKQPHEAAMAAAGGAAPGAGGEGVGLGVERQFSGSEGVEEAASSVTSAGAPAPDAHAGPVAPGPASASLLAQQQAFRHTLDQLTQRCYNMVRDALKRQVIAVLPECVQAPPPPPPASLPHSPEPEPGPSAAWLAASGLPAAAPGAFVLDEDEEELANTAGSPVDVAVTPREPRGPGLGDAPGSPPAAAAAPPSPGPWLQLIDVLWQHTRILRDEACVPRIVVKCLLKQVLRFVDNQVFNQLLLRPECCCTSNARAMVAGLQQLDAWIAGGAGGTDDLHLLADDLRHVRQASHFLVLANKGSLKLEDIIAVCPSLNAQQLYRLCTTFYDDTPQPQPAAALLQPQAQPQAQAAPHLQQPQLPAEPLPEGSAAAADGGGSASDPGPDSGTGGVGVGVAPAEEEEGAGAQEDAAGEAREERPDAAETPAGAADGAMTGTGSGDLPAEAPAAAAVQPSAAHTPVAAAVAPPPSSLGAGRNVSGEVLEEMKRHHAVVGNGGLIVTFLLDDDGHPLIAPPPANVVSHELLGMVNEPRLHHPLAVPASLVSDDCPRQVFAFLEGEGGPRSSTDA